jgi:bifunctional non-homologous end joining protein LigD
VATTAVPEWMEPMAATLTRERFAGPGWVFERKLDGIRLLAFKDGPRVRLLSRNRLPQNAAYPQYERAVAALPVDQVILDGEATGWFGQREEIGYHVFDILWLNGRDLTTLTLDARRALLDALPLGAPLLAVPRLDDDRPWERAASDGWEGVIAKRRDAPYEHRRSPHWLKMKCEASQELVVGGFTDPQGKRVGLGALLVGFFDGQDLVFAGKVGTGPDNKTLLDIRRRLDALEISATPFTRATGLPRLRVHWVRPELVVQVAFMEWTGHDKLRHPRLVGVREDKAARDVVRERA